jgi:hypothetical protein
MHLDAEVNDITNNDRQLTQVVFDKKHKKGCPRSWASRVKLLGEQDGHKCK